VTAPPNFSSSSSSSTPLEHKNGGRILGIHAACKTSTPPTPPPQPPPPPPPPHYSISCQLKMRAPIEARFMELVSRSKNKECPIHLAKLLSLAADTVTLQHYCQMQSDVEDWTSGAMTELNSLTSTMATAARNEPMALDNIDSSCFLNCGLQCLNTVAQQMLAATSVRAGPGPASGMETLRDQGVLLLSRQVHG
jgi:hypothetical protein